MAIKVWWDNPSRYKIFPQLQVSSSVPLVRNMGLEILVLGSFILQYQPPAQLCREDCT